MVNNLRALAMKIANLGMIRLYYHMKIHLLYRLHGEEFISRLQL